MADPRDRVPETVPGKYYVDTQCIDCDVCRVTAPANFQRDEEKGYSYVFRQPANREEEALCQEAMDCCPVEAIGDDGEAAPQEKRSPLAATDSQSGSDRK